MTATVRTARRRSRGPRNPDGLPWELRDLARLLRWEIATAIAIGVCWFGAKHTSGWAGQLYWTAGAIGAMGIAGMAWGTWLLIGTREVRLRQRRLARLLAHPEAAAAVAGVPGALVSSPAMHEFHAPGCLLVRGKAVTASALSAHEAAGRTPCRMCLP